MKQIVNIEKKNNVEYFSKELKVVCVYSIKTVVSHRKKGSVMKVWV